MQVIDCTEENGSPVIVLVTGYEVDTSEDNWTEHLELALIGELFIRPEGDWDDRMRFLVAEIARIPTNMGLAHSPGSATSSAGSTETSKKL